MKVSIAVIKLVLRTNKTLANGSHPIMLRVSFNGMKERSSGYSCTLKFWDKKNECVKRGYPNFVMVNAELKKMKELQKPTVNLLALAQTVGKSATTLHQYISLLGDVDLV